MSILDHFPLKTPRSGQVHTLTSLEKSWSKYDVFVISAPVASGKSAMAIAIQDWVLSRGAGCFIGVPNNILRDQYMEDFSHLATIRAKSDYWLKQYKMTQAEFCSKVYKFGPRGSEYFAHLKAIKRHTTPAIGNYYTYLAHKLQRPVLIVDEAHQMLSMLQDLHSRKVWKHEVQYPTNITSLADLTAWVESQLPNTKLEVLHKELTSLSPATVLQFGTALYRGEERDCIKLLPLDVSSEPPILWPPKVKKIVLMSATISREDLADMGLGKRRVLFIDVPSPIPAEQRPIKYEPVGYLNHKSFEFNLSSLVSKLHELAARHPTKGFVHVTYEMARILRPYLNTNPRFRFHSASTKTAVYSEFLASDPAEGRIMVGSGLTEGIDLRDDLADWQAICKVPYPSLEDPSMRWLTEHKPANYLWHCSKEVLQASGRICRTPTDYGITYLLDTGFRTWYTKAKPSLPSWFKINNL